ncbi:uncharacterized protein LOC132203980 [Neocloeon triangulifer]|uniref:uncharacterized protein LOC132203980 n=1 Tax=Neocloeon triangulifer TaxID=2078957 RepID=UPI00286F1783|nr:uncharacterized protein LOC132203980 [Neocloeon triangulifer]XP_059488147.1 uncharacterized protein LOC132203980 [Neocloeon triangulifer]XP_059488148.1 uncharacterized protein LOC132203980 [Neocloeon triangulifer]XP_059488149.1 uncharacterized protein LOC132203980 [Neocloeon triangulifer]
MGLDRIWPNWLVFFHFLLIVLSQPSRYCNNQTLDDCSEQVFGEHKTSSDTCELKKIERSECPNQQLSGENNEDLGKITINSYFYNLEPSRLVSYNISFSNIKWDHAIMRYTLHGKEGEQMFCRSFEISGIVLPEKELTYDCNWWNISQEKGRLKVEVMLAKGSQRTYKKLALRIQENEYHEHVAKSANQWEVFTYVDVTSEEEISVHMENPKEFGNFSYRVKAVHVVDGKEKIIAEKLTNSTVATFKSSELQLPLFFYVEPIGENCRNACRIAKTLTILYEPTSYAALVFSIVPILIVLAIFALFIFVYIPTKRRHQLIGIPKPSVVIMYNGNHDFHSSLVKDFADFLTSKNMDIHLDIDEISKLSDPDPSKWCSGVIYNADVILIVSSPSCCPNKGEGIYGRQVYDAMEREIRNNVAQPKCRLVRVQLPYCSTRDFPAKMNYTIFNIPREMTSLINFVHNLNNSAHALVLPFSKREGSDLINLNKNIYQAGLYMEAHDVQEDTKGSMVTLPLIEDVADEINETKSYEQVPTEPQSPSQYPDMKRMKLLGEDGDNGREGNSQIRSLLENEKI